MNFVRKVYTLTFSRELKRNSINGFYSPSRAQNTYNDNKRNCGRNNILDSNIELKEAILLRLKQDWSPEQISGRFKLDNEFSISFKTIYRAIDVGLLEVSKKEVLRRKGKSKKHGIIETRGKINNKKMINERPFSPDDRSEIGHFESDTVNGLLRQYFPKGSNFENITQEDLDTVVHKINTRPRKVLGFRTAYEVFWNEVDKKCCI